LTSNGQSLKISRLETELMFT